MCREATASDLFNSLSLLVSLKKKEKKIKNYNSVVETTFLDPRKIISG